MKKFYLKQKVFSMRDSFQVFDENQKTVYHAHAKMFSIKRQYRIYRSVDETLLFTMRRRIFSFLPTYELFNAKEEQVALMRNRFAAFKNRIDIEAGEDVYYLEGSVWAHSFTISSNNQIVLAVRKKILAWGDTYEIEVEDAADIDKMIAFVIMIDSIYHRKKSKQSSRYRR